MKAKSRQSGLTLIEQTVVIAIVSLLTVFGLPAVRTLFHSLASSGNARAMISAGLASARAIAAKEQRYAGVRFQKAYHPEGPLEAPQYMVFIVHEEPARMDGLTIGFRAVEGLEPIRLPDGVGVMDLTINGIQPVAGDSDVMGDNLTDTTAFSIIFSPSGKMVIHDVRVRNRDGIYQPDNAVPAKVSMDDIFNSLENIVNHNKGMFIQDDYASLGKEPSRRRFIIYETEIFRQAYEQVQPYSGYLVRLVPEAIYINPYTGTIISSD